MTREVARTEDGRYVVIDGRRWRTADPALPDDVRTRLLHHLGVARSAVRTAADDSAVAAAARARLQLAKTGLGERGTACERTSLPHRSQARGGTLQGGR